MSQRIKGWLAGGVVMALALCLTGCGESAKDAKPANPDAPKLEQKTPNGGAKAGPKGGSI